MAAVAQAAPTHPVQQSLSPDEMAAIIAQMSQEDDARVEAEEVAFEKWEEAQWEAQQQQEAEFARAEADRIARVIEETYVGDDSQVVVTAEMRHAMLFMANAATAENDARAAEEASQQQVAKGVAAVAGSKAGQHMTVAEASAAATEAALPALQEAEEEEAEEDLLLEDRYVPQPSPRRPHGPLFQVEVGHDDTAAAEAMFAGLAGCEDEIAEIEETSYAEEERLYYQEQEQQRLEAEALMVHIEPEEGVDGEFSGDAVAAAAAAGADPGDDAVVARASASQSVVPLKGVEAPTTATAAAAAAAGEGQQAVAAAEPATDAALAPAVAA